MAALLDWIKQRSSVEYSESGGTHLAVQTVRKFDGRTFKFKGAGMRHRAVPADEIIRFIEQELPHYYSYSTEVKTWLDKNGTGQAHLKIEGSVSLRRPSSRFNPLNLTFIINTDPSG